MDSLFDKMINLNVELEGTLRVVRDRRSPEAVEAARNKFAELARLFETVSVKEDEKGSDTTGLKIEEAESAEKAPMPEPLTPDGHRMLDKIRATENETPFVKDSKPKDIRKCFTLNDRFLFKRELFGNNDDEFNATLELLASMTSFEEVEEYVYEDLRWERATPRVRDFMNILQSYFE